MDEHNISLVVEVCILLDICYYSFLVFVCLPSISLYYIKTRVISFGIPISSLNLINEYSPKERERNPRARIHVVNTNHECVKQDTFISFQEIKPRYGIKRIFLSDPYICKYVLLQSICGVFDPWKLINFVVN